LEAESTSFSRYNRGECTARNGEEERETGEKVRRDRNTWETGGREGMAGATRKRRGIRDFVCLPVRPSEPEGTSAAASFEEELGRETNTSAEETTAGEEGE